MFVHLAVLSGSAIPLVAPAVLLALPWRTAAVLRSSFPGGAIVLGLLLSTWGSTSSDPLDGQRAVLCGFGFLVASPFACSAASAGAFGTAEAVALSYGAGRALLPGYGPIIGCLRAAAATAVVAGGLAMGCSRFPNAHSICLAIFLIALCWFWRGFGQAVRWALDDPWWALLWVGSVACALGVGQKMGSRLVARKALHVASVAVIPPAIVCGRRGQLAVALAGAVWALVVAEAVRASRLPPLGRHVRRLAERFKDDRDAGKVIGSHFALLLGLAFPVWMAEALDLGMLPSMAGAVAIGVGDASAAVVGRGLGRVGAWSGKTVEGGVAFAFASWWCLGALGGGWWNKGVMIGCLGSAVMEASCERLWDNVASSLFMFASLASF